MTQTVSLPRRAFNHCRRHGFVSTVRTVHKFLLQRVADRLLLNASGDRLSEYAQTTTTVERPYELTISYDGQHETVPDCLNERIGMVSIPARRVYKLPQSTIFGGTDLVRTNRRYLATATIGTNRTQSTLARRSFVQAGGFKRAFQDSVTPSRRIERLPTVFLLAGRKTQFAHWFYETLPKLRAFERVAQDQDAGFTLVVQGPLTAWQRESLRLLGYPPDLYREHSAGHLSSNRLFVASHRLRRGGGEFIPSPADLRWLRERIVSKIPRSDGSHSPYLYVSRTDATRRQVCNGTAVIEALRPLGFERIIPGELPYEEQVRAFSTAEIIVGPHGAGLTNMLYATDATVVELLTGHGSTPHFFVMANELGFDYEFHHCEPVRDDDIEPRHWDMIANPEKLRALVAPD